MPIKGIDHDKCINCLQCLKDCPASCFYLNEEDNRVQFDKHQPCILCGHCIAICPTDAILYKRMKGEILSFESIQQPEKIVTHESIEKFLLAKRSIRQYKKKKLPKEMMEKLLNAMSYASTGTNVRNLKCLIISDDEKIKQLSTAVLNELLTNPNVPNAYKNVLKRRSETVKDTIFYEAPHVIILHSNNVSDVVNATITITYAMIAAHSLGLGTCWIGLANGVLIANKEIRNEIAGISDKVLGVFIIGYPASKYFRIPPRPAIRVEGLEELE